MTTNDAPFRFTPGGDISVLQLLPELNNVQWGEIDAIGTQVLGSLESQSQPCLIVDLSPLSYMGSAMVALIVRVWKAAQAKNGKLCVICPHPGVHEVLKLAALDKVWSIVGDMSEARSTLGLGRLSGSSNVGSSSGGANAGVWIIGVILLVACGALVAFAVNPGWLGLKSEEQASAGQSDQQSNDSQPASGSGSVIESVPGSEGSVTTDPPVQVTSQAKPQSPVTEKSAPEKVEPKPESKPKSKPAVESKTK